MPRTARFLLPDWPVHLYQRGHNRSPCFDSPQLCGLYLGLLQELSSAHECVIHAYVLMTNHFHLLMTPATREGASELMRRVNQRYSQHVNRKRERVGTLWQGRFKASIVDSQEYFFTCQRYIELNPVRAGMVGSPAAYDWSSYKTNAEGQPSALIKPHARYVALGKDDNERRAAYRRLFQVPITTEELGLIRAAAMSSSPLGSPEFAVWVRTSLQEQTRDATSCVPGASPVLV